MCQSHDIITRHAIVEGSGNFDHLAFFIVHCHCTVHGPLAFCLHKNATAMAGIEPATFGSTAWNTCVAAELGSGEFLATLHADVKKKNIKIGMYKCKLLKLWNMDMCAREKHPL